MDTLLINKHSYKQIVQTLPHQTELEQLAILLNQPKEEQDCSEDDIRYAQGELYFQMKDFETAIFKWEQVNGEKAPWAKKNIADAYDAQGQTKDARRMYQSIKSSDVTLKTEVYLQLFSILMEEGKLDDAAKTIKDAVELNPDYPNITEIARAFFEEYRDYSSALELAIREAIRTEQLSWFDKVADYIKQGLTTTTNPSYFTDFLNKLAELDGRKYEQIVDVIWESYSGEELYFDWLLEFNQIFSHTHGQEGMSWPLLSRRYETTYLELVSGKYFLKEIESIMPLHLKNWQRLTKKSEDVFSVTAIVAWNEIFANQLDESDVFEAKESMRKWQSNKDWLENSLMLFQEIANWAKKNGLDVSGRLRWFIEQLLDFDSQQVTIIGASKAAKHNFLENVVGPINFSDDHESFIFLKDGEELVTEIDQVRTELENSEDLPEHEVETLTDNQDFSVLEVQWPSPFLSQNQLTFIDTPLITRDEANQDSWFKYLPISDSIIFVLNGNHPFTDQEREFLLKVKNKHSDIPLHFIFNKMDGIYSEYEEERILTETRSRINYYFPNAQIHSYNPKDSLSLVSEFIQSTASNVQVEQKRSEKVLYFIRETIAYLFEQRVSMEKDHFQSVHWNEQMKEKLNAAVHQLEDLQKEEGQNIIGSYQQIRTNIKKEIESKIPELIRECKELVKEDSDFRTLSVVLNEQVNERIREYLNTKVMPKVTADFQRWLETSNVAFIRSQSYLKEMAQGFNKLYREERFNMDGDFRILDDWHRDVERMSAGVAIEPVNLFNRMSPSQLMLKGSGRLFASLPNKAMVYKMYVKFFQTEDFTQVAKRIANQFLMQFELFERGLERDVQIFFKRSFNVIEEAKQDTERAIEANNSAIDTLQSQPEIYRDPLTLFKVRVRQYEWLTKEEQEFEMKV